MTQSYCKIPEYKQQVQKPENYSLRYVYSWCHILALLLGQETKLLSKQNYTLMKIHAIRVAMLCQWACSFQCFKWLQCLHSGSSSPTFDLPSNSVTYRKSSIFNGTTERASKSCTILLCTQHIVTDTIATHHLNSPAEL